MFEKILEAYKLQWGSPSKIITPKISKDLVKEFSDVKILEFEPSRLHDVWIYASLGMSSMAIGEKEVPEIHIYSREKSDAAIDAISSVIEYCQSNEILFGDVFSCIEEKNNDKCSLLMASYPESDGVGFIETYTEDKQEILFILLLPITLNEKLFLEKNGLDALEEKFLEKEFKEFDWDRKSAI